MFDLSNAWVIVVGLATLFCIGRGIDDLRKGRRIWGALGLALGLALALVPIQTHAVKIDLPAAGEMD